MYTEVEGDGSDDGGFFLIDGMTFKIHLLRHAKYLFENIQPNVEQVFGTSASHKRNPRSGKLQFAQQIKRYVNVDWVLNRHRAAAGQHSWIGLKMYGDLSPVSLTNIEAMKFRKTVLDEYFETAEGKTKWVFPEASPWKSTIANLPSKNNYPVEQSKRYLAKEVEVICSQLKALTDGYLRVLDLEGVRHLGIADPDLAASLTSFEIFRDYTVRRADFQKEHIEFLFRYLGFRPYRKSSRPWDGYYEGKSDRTKDLCLKVYTGASSEDGRFRLRIEFVLSKRSLSNLGISVRFPTTPEILIETMERLDERYAKRVRGAVAALNSNQNRNLPDLKSDLALILRKEKSAAIEKIEEDLVRTGGVVLNTLTPHYKRRLLESGILVKARQPGAYFLHPNYRHFPVVVDGAEGQGDPQAA